MYLKIRIPRKSAMIRLLQMRLLVTGASGFVGKTFLMAMAKSNNLKKFELVTLAGHKNEVPKEIIRELKKNVKVDVHYQDLSQPWNLNASTTHVLNLAADGSQHPYSTKSIQKYFEINHQFVQWCKNSAVTRIVHTSSGVCDYLANDGESAILQTSNKFNFAMGRNRVENIILSLSTHRPVSISILRLYSFVGPHLLEYNSYAVTQFLQMAQKNRLIKVLGNPESRRSYLSEYDLGKILVEGVTNREFSSMVSVGGLEPVSLGDLARFIGSLTHAEVLFEGTGKPREDYFPIHPHSTLPRAQDIRRPWRETIEDMVVHLENE
jgi:nucleoside-diphosphate-sugar epimerase